MFIELVEGIRLILAEANYQGSLKKGGGRYPSRRQGKHRGYVKQTTSRSTRRSAKAGSREAMQTGETPDIAPHSTLGGD